MTAQSARPPSAPIVVRTVAPFVLVLGVAAGAGAQATTVVTPSIDVGAVYDDNILWTPTPIADRIWRLSPSVTFSRETRRTRWDGAAEVDSEWFAAERQLSTPLARQHAMTRSEWRVNDRYTFGVTGSYDNTVTPQELNVITGLTAGRFRAWRWSASPEATGRLSSRTRLVARYRLTGDYSQLVQDLLTHDAELLAEQGVGERTEIRARYMGQFFQLEGSPVLWTHTPLFGFSRRLTASTRFVLDGGVRFGLDRLRPEIDAALMRRTTFTETALTYNWTQATALGVGAELIDVQSVTGLLRYEWPQSFDVSLRGGGYLNGLHNDRIEVYRAALDLNKRLFGIVWFGMSYTFDYQRGRVALVPDPPGGAVITPADQPVPPVVTTPGTDRIRRSMVMVRISLIAPVRHAAGPREPAAAPGRVEPIGLPGITGFGEPEGGGRER
jgi:hypothetical protein